ncbi:MAG: HesA/MoeB/ThiF family protein [Deltaproteobacteria bacterium]|nr:HesA/MoeB/ThiF family protein [Deltaproteobacteria bacterium]
MAVVGIGGLGAAAALELAERGIDRLGLVDADRVEISNLHRQILHETADVGRPKAEVAAEKLRRLRPSIAVEPSIERLTSPGAAARRLAGYDVVIDATDNAAAKFLLNDVCVDRGQPLVHAGAIGFHGQLFTIVPGRGACLRCLFPEPPSEEEAGSCRDAGILGPLAALIGVLQARAALRVLAGTADVDRLLTFDARTLELREVSLRRSARCPACGPRAAARGAAAAHPQSKET